MSDAKSIGQNVRTARRYRGMSLETLAGLIGKSKGWLSAIENGHIRLDKRSDIAAIVEVLRVSATDILGGPSPTIEPRQRDVGDAVRLREALMENGIDDPLRSEARPLDVLRAELDEVVIPARMRSARPSPGTFVDAPAFRSGRNRTSAEQGKESRIAVRAIRRRPRRRRARPPVGR